MNIKCLAVTGVLAAMAVSSAIAEDAYPSRAVSIIVGFAPGGSTDLVARATANYLQAKLGQPFTVDNRPGANGMLAAEIVSQATPDGYTLLITSNSPLTVNPLLYPDVSYDPIADFTPIGKVVEHTHVLVINPKNPIMAGVKNLHDFIDVAKANPGLAYASGGVGNLAHIEMEALAEAGGFRMTHIPYGGGSQVDAAVVNQEVVAAFGNTNVTAQIEAGNMLALGIAAGHRFDNLLPGVPTLAEQGIDGYDYSYWTAVMAPASLPEAASAVLSKAIAEARQDPEFLAQVLKFGELGEDQTPAEFQQAIVNEIDRNRALLETANIKIE